MDRRRRMGRSRRRGRRVNAVKRPKTTKNKAKQQLIS